MPLDRVLLPVLRVTPAAAAALDRAGVRLGVSTAAVVELLTRHSDRLSDRDVVRLPSGFRGRRGAGRRKKAEYTVTHVRLPDGAAVQIDEGGTA